jgi:hypothetical protein
VVAQLLCVIALALWVGMAERDEAKATEQGHD